MPFRTTVFTLFLLLAAFNRLPVAGFLSRPAAKIFFDRLRPSPLKTTT